MDTPVAGKLRSVRTLLARLKCAFACQEAKLDKVLGMTSSGKICLHEIQVWNTAKRQVITESEFHDIYSSSDEESDFESVFPM